LHASVEIRTARIYPGMNRTTISIVTLLVWASLAFGVNDLQMAKIMAVTNYGHGRIAFWEGRVPLFDEYPFYDITLKIGSRTYIVRYESMTGYYPPNLEARRPNRSASAR
jgi:hypothetical protein